MNGWLNCYKPIGMTSNQVVSKARKALGIKKIGHAGTLDPFACGVLPLAVGEATKTISFCVNSRKVYKLEMLWGEKTDTADHTGEVTAESDRPLPNLASLEKVVQEFVGGYEQMPPAYSALKVDGKRAYELARAGKEVKLKVRSVQIFAISVLEHNSETMRSCMRVECGPGTYIRTQIGRAHV